MDSQGFFITFEGVEGSGKTTQLRRLDKTLRQSGRAVVVTREPGGCPIADAIRRILLDPDNHSLVPRAELLLYAAARAQHVDEVIRPALAAGAVVLCDRFTAATMAYQGFGRGLDQTVIGELNRLACGDVIPDLTLLFDLAAEEGLQRALARNHDQQLTHEGRFEAEALAFHQRVRQGYLTLAAGHPNWVTIDARGDESVIATRVQNALTPFLPGVSWP